jgi:hypothetical protein
LFLRWRKWQEAGEDCILRKFIASKLNHIYYYGDQVKKYEMVVARVGEMIMHKIFLLGNLMVTHHSVNPGVDGRIIIRVGNYEHDAYGSG